MSLPACEAGAPAGGALRRALAGSLLSSVLSIWPGYPPAWRFELRPVPAAVLMVGEPTPGLAYAAAGAPGSMPGR